MLLATFLFLFASFLVPIQALAFSINRGSTSSSCSYSLWGHSGNGYKTSDGACRYTVRYATAERWGVSSSTTFDYDQTWASLPPTCPQDSGTYVSGTSQSEDCLFATVYVPVGSAPTGGWPVFVWIHGGSFDAGGESSPGLDGSKFAVESNIIVIFLQYRLGIFGFLPPSLSSTSSDPNLGLQDVVVGLAAVQTYVGYIGGDRQKVTVGGQSSGASLIRALWGTPSASGLFRGAILQSDPMNYGFASKAITTSIQDIFYASSPMSSCSTLSCLQNISISDVIAAQDTLVSAVPYEVDGVPASEPLRPTYGTATLPSDPTVVLSTNPSSLTFPPSSLPVLISTVKNEGGSATESLFSSPLALSNTTYYAYASALIGTDRAEALVTSSSYSLPAANSTDDYGVSGDTFRETFEKAVTQGIWTCPNRYVAKTWKAAGGKVWVAEWREGVAYPDNAVSGGYCAKSGVVCHEDDIYPTFSSAPSLTSASSLESAVLSYWSAFIKNLDPNPSSSKGSSEWKQYSSESTVHALGGDGKVSTCPDGFWGETAEYDWQLYG